MRNRAMENGEEWLTDECKIFFQSKLYQNNEEFSALKKIIYTLAYPIRMIVWFCSNGVNNKTRVKKHFSRKLRWKKNGTE